MKHLYKKFSGIIFLLPFLAWSIAYFTQPYRYSDQRNIYLTGVVVVYSCWLTAFVWGLINAIFLYKEDIKLKEKLIFMFISLFPLILFLSFLISIPFV